MKYQNINNKFLSYLILMLVFINFACKKFLQVPPPTNQVVSSTVFTNDAIATSAVIGIYSEMMNTLNQFSNSSTTLYAGMSADELYYYFPGQRDEFIKNQISQANHSNITLSFWTPCYKYIYASNLAIEQLNNSSNISVDVKAQLIGESKFIRAFCYFYLVNLFGDVPLTTTSDYNVNANLPRSPKASVYSQIINDLKEAQSLLLASYPTAERVRPNKWAATALLSRVYLYNEDWNNAETQATMVISSGSYNMPTDLSKVFLRTSPEAIWQLLPVRPNFNTYEGYAILPASSGSSPSYLLTNTLLTAFEVGDQRRIIWVASRVYSGQTLYYPYKYKVFNGSTLTEYYMIFRLAEQYLIRAEARAQLNNISGAQADLNIIRNRAGLPNTSSNTQYNLLNAIEQEKRIELFSEWGHRWFDLKRTGKANAILGTLKPLTWQPTDVLWPIPQDQIDLNPALTQNPGY